MSGFESVPYCTLVSGTKYRIQYHNVSAPHSGKALGTFEKLMIDFDLTEDEDAEDAELVPMDTIGYAIFNDVHPVHGAKKTMGMDGFRTDGHKYAFPVFSQEGEVENVVANDEVSFYTYTLPAHQSRMSRKILNKHTNVDVANEHSKQYFDKTTGGRRWKRTVKRRGGKPRITKKNKPRSRRKPTLRYHEGRLHPLRSRRATSRWEATKSLLDPRVPVCDLRSETPCGLIKPYRGQPYQGPPYQGPSQPSYVDPMAAQPRPGALPQAMQLSWGDAAKLAAANAAGAVVAVVGEEAFEDV